MERRLFFQPYASSLSLCFLRVFCFCPFFGPSQILRQATSFYQCCICKRVFFFTSFAGHELNFDTLQPREGKQRLPLKSS